MSFTATQTVIELPPASFSLRKDDQTQITVTPASQLPSRQPSPSSSQIFNAAPSQALLPGYSRYLIILLVILANLAQFISNATTIGAGFTLSSELGSEVGPGKANWMPAAYPLSQGAVVLVSGRLGAIYGHQLLVLIGTGTLVVLSIANGFCNTYESFIAVRALTGVGGGLVMPNAVAVTTTMIPPGRSRNIALGFFGAAAPIGGWLGILVAGIFTQVEKWRWMFFTLAIIGAIILASLLALLPKETPVDKGGKIDYPGAFLGLGGLLLFNFAWNEAPSAGWNSASSIATLGVSVAMFSAFLVWESRFTAHPIMPLTIFRAPTFTALIFVVLLTYMSFGISLWYMTAWQQLVRGWSVLHYAAGFVPFGVGATAAVFLSAWLIPRLAAQWVMAIGVVMSLAANLILATMPAQQSYWAQTFPAIVLSSVCPDFVYVAAQIIASNSAGRKQQGVAGSLIGTLNLYGNALGLGFAGTIETEVAKGGGSDALRGYRAALYFGAALAVAALALDFAFVRMPKDEREGWDGEEEVIELGPVRGEATGVETGSITA